MCKKILSKGFLEKNFMLLSKTGLGNIRQIDRQMYIIQVVCIQLCCPEGNIRQIDSQTDVYYKDR